MESMLIITARFLCVQILFFITIVVYYHQKRDTATSLMVFPKFLSLLSYLKCQTSGWSLTPLTFCAESLFQTDWGSFLTSNLIQEGSLTLLKAKNLQCLKETTKSHR